MTKCERCGGYLIIRGPSTCACVDSLWPSKSVAASSATEFRLDIECIKLATRVNELENQVMSLKGLLETAIAKMGPLIRAFPGDKQSKCWVTAAKRSLEDWK